MFDYAKLKSIKIDVRFDYFRLIEYRGWQGVSVTGYSLIVLRLGISVSLGLSIVPV